MPGHQRRNLVLGHLSKLVAQYSLCLSVLRHGSSFLGPQVQPHAC